MAETTFHVEKVANIPEMVTQMLRRRTNPTQKGRMLPARVVDSTSLPIVLLSQMFRHLRRSIISGDELKKTLISVASKRDNKTMREEYWEDI